MEWRLNERIILQANDKYHLGAPTVKRVLYNLAGGSPLTQYENNEIDIFISINDIERVQSNRDPLNQGVRAAPELSVDYIGFNTQQAPFDDPKVRLAFAKAIDREKMTKVVFKDLLAPPRLHEPGMPGYDQTRNCRVRPGAAKRCWQDSKYKDGWAL